jgi:lipopolysaccharide export system protein LptC
MTTSSADNTNGNGHASSKHAPSRHALAHWEPRHALSLDAARRHSSFIRNARLALMVFSGILLLILLWYFVSTPKPKPQEDNPDETVKMINPVYKGRTADNLPFRITADEAVRFLQNPDETKLVNPVLNFLRSGEVEESMVLALTGLYNSETQVLELRQDVNLKTDDGYDCKTSHARIFVKEKRIEGDEAISCTGRFGRVSGTAYEINDNYEEFVFKGGMTALIVPEKTANNNQIPTDTVTQLRGGQE